MSEVLLSICISSYNRVDRCCRLVENILKIEDVRYNIFICDDSSDEETIDKLRSLRNNKVALIENKKNVGPCQNWYRTITCGDGKYILHVLDRDDINVNFIKTILDILDDHFVGAGYIGNSALDIDNRGRGMDKFTILEKGEEAFLAMAGIPIHPTGFLVNREKWKKGNYFKFFSDDAKYGIYPHSYVLGRIAAENNMLYMPCAFCSYTYTGTNKKSRFYEKKKQKSYWWVPDDVIKTANRMILYLFRFADDTYKEEFICERFRGGLYRATMTYRFTASDALEMGHYGINAYDVSDFELIGVSLKYLFVFIHILRKLEIGGRHIWREILKIFINNLKIIVRAT